MSAHTRGPWTLEKLPLARDAWIRARGEHVSGCVCEVRVSSWHHEAQRAEQEANARLIAAAPELLDALRAMRARFLCTHPDDGAVLSAADSAIAKAEGGVA